MKTTVILFLSICALVLRAQTEAIAGRALFVVKEEYEQVFSEAFASQVSESKQFDPQKARIADGKSIAELLGLPASVKPTALKPFAPQHSVALPELRRRTNPILWTRGQSIRVAETETIARLRQAESRVSRTFELIYEGSAEAAMTALKKSGMAETVEPRYRRYPQYTPNDSLFPQQWALPLIHAPEAWNIVKGDPSLMVAVVDVGTDWEHPDLRDAIFINGGETGIDEDGYDKRANALDDDGNGFIDDWHGWDFAGTAGDAPDNNPTAYASHGTHTGGIMAASGDNKTGVAGVAYGAKLLALKASDEGGASIDFGYDAMIYAADMGALSVNNSWGGSTRSEIEQDIVNYVTAKNCVVVAASGNNGLYQDFFPASYKGVLSVASNDPGGGVSGFANYGTKVDVSAPGNGVLSTVPSYWGYYSTLTGTSMASPHAAGAIALVRKQFPEYDALQAAERLRATADVVEVDPSREDLTGKGRINLFRAVSRDSIAYSARLEKFDLFDDNGNRILESGESAAIVLSARNYLAPLQNLRAQIEIINGAEHVQKTATFLNLGPANTLEVVQNIQGTFVVTASASTPPNTRVLVKVTFFDPFVMTYLRDVDYFSFTVNPAYQDLNANNLIVTLDSKGSIGFNDPPVNNQGSGFQWRNAPPQITAKGRSVLWQAGLMAGIDAGHLIASAPSEFEGFSDQDWRIEKTIRYVAPPSHIRAAQELDAAYSDDNYDTVSQVGFRVDQHSFAFTSGLAANAVVLDYLLTKRPTPLGAQPTDETAVALFMDWDIGLSGANNRAYLDADNRTAITDRLEAGYPVVGVKVISDIPTGAELQYYALNNDGSDGSVSTYGGYDDYEKWASMTVPRSQAGPGDVSTIYGLKNIPFAQLDSVRLTYAISLATDVATLRQTMAETEQEWKTTGAVRQKKLPTDGVFIYPNPARDRFNIYLNGSPEETATLDIYDMLGRVVLHDIFRGSFEVSSLPAGAYRARIATARSVSNEEIVILP